MLRKVSERIRGVFLLFFNAIFWVVVLLSVSCAMSWDECEVNGDCGPLAICVKGKCVLPDSMVDVIEEGIDVIFEMEVEEDSFDGDDFCCENSEATIDSTDSADALVVDELSVDVKEEEGGISCEGGCHSPPDDQCYATEGECRDGICYYETLPAGTSCDDSDPCTENDVCDGSGRCSGNEISCSRPHTTGGHCVGGSCTGFSCEDGWGNCDSNWDTGCETRLNDVNNCGSCGNVCTGRANATAYCDSGICNWHCTSPYENCNGDWSDGCEIPTGVPAQCDRYGLNSTQGCGTAYCGSSSHANAQNFGSWYCIGCQTCHHFPDGYSWCLNLSIGGNIRWSEDRCESCCGPAYEDLTCGP